MAASKWKNSLKNVESDNNKILHETLLDFFYSEMVLTFWISLEFSETFLNISSFETSVNHTCPRNFMHHVQYSSLNLRRNFKKPYPIIIITKIYRTNKEGSGLTLSLCLSTNSILASDCKLKYKHHILTRSLFHCEKHYICFDYFCFLQSKSIQ